MYDHPLFVQTLSAFTHTLLTPYDTQTMLEELTDRVTAVLSLTGSGVALAVDGHLTLASALPNAVADLERLQQSVAGLEGDTADPAGGDLRVEGPVAGRGGDHAGPVQRPAEGRHVVGADDRAGVAQQLGLAALGDDATGADHHDVVGDDLDLAQQV